ncbi:hypothetical protein FJQ54_09845 [Sandaracinobacter neustonicus]|uniref:Uncharacterized protein n=1 Tax=Sandaracinobacter neustonicus TaxID=1715348 RepID=A0A501XLK6_9SPHN|nr:hypothetical protein [Sandaracinobacter neustonicus]TPE61183.1 hypothetical protein FJQ54_09845 [Sandaracinobacter neustonicus]
MLAFVRLIVLGVIAALSAGNATASSNNKAATMVAPDLKRMLVNFETRTISTDDWSSQFVDCSDANYNCISVPDKVALAFARKCDLTKAERASIPHSKIAGRVFVVAPMAHYGLPSGTYILEALPTALMFYDQKHGLTELRELLSSPYETEFDPNAYRVRYKIITADGGPLFRCT